MNEKRRAMRAKMLRENVQVIQVLVLTAVIVIFAIVNLITPVKEYSAGENRNLAGRPALQKDTLEDGSFFADLDTYYSDQFVLRDRLVGLHAAAALLSGQKELNGVYLGKDKYLMAKPEIPSSGQIERISEAVNSFAKAHDTLRTEVLAVPDAASVLTEKRPAGVPARDQLADLGTLKDALDETIIWLDGTAPLQNHGDTQVYYRTDHHWTSAGARLVFEGIADGMGIDSPVKEYDHYIVSDTFEGTLSSRSGVHRAKDEIEVYTPLGTDVEYYVYYPDTNEKTTSLFNSEALSQKDQYTVFFGGNHPLVEIHTTAKSGKSLLIFKDSYANSFVQFLYPYYDNIIMIDPRYYYENAESVIRSQGITDVLILYSADTLFADTALADCLNAAE